MFWRRPGYRGSRSWHDSLISTPAGMLLQALCWPRMCILSRSWYPRVQRTVGPRSRPWADEQTVVPVLRQVPITVFFRISRCLRRWVKSANCGSPVNLPIDPTRSDSVLIVEKVVPRRPLVVPHPKEKRR